jgi:hypothetical protein
MLLTIFLVKCLIRLLGCAGILNSPDPVLRQSGRSRSRESGKRMEVDVVHIAKVEKSSIVNADDERYGDEQCGSRKCVRSIDAGLQPLVSHLEDESHVA